MAPIDPHSFTDLTHPVTTHISLSLPRLPILHHPRHRSLLSLSLTPTPVHSLSTRALSPSTPSSTHSPKLPSPISFPFSIADLLSLQYFFSLSPPRRPAQPSIEGLKTLSPEYSVLSSAPTVTSIRPSLSAILFSLPRVWWVSVCVARCGGSVVG